jgi:hypothetical protein
VAENGTFTEEELALLVGEFELEFAANEASAWTYLMTADRYAFVQSKTLILDCVLVPSWQSPLLSLFSRSLNRSTGPSIPK